MGWVLMSEREVHRFEVRHKGFSLPHRVFDPDPQRLTHAAITENKHPSATLAHASEIQDARLAEPAKVGKQRTKYTPTGRKPSGPKGWAEKRADAVQPKRQRQPSMPPDEPDRRTGQACDIWGLRPARSCSGSVTRHF